MRKTVCELFAGVGGFRCGLNHINTIEDTKKKEKWRTVWFSQWEPSDKKTQWAHDCYVNRFGSCIDLNNEDTTNWDVSTVKKDNIPDHTLLVGGFPCQDYSVSQALKTSKGIEGKKGVLWWSIYDILKAKKPPFVLLENVDRLIKSPAKQRGRDFGIILACFAQQGYTVEWRVINAADYGFQQRRRRTFIFAYRNDTKYAQRILKAVKKSNEYVETIFNESGFFAKSFPIKPISYAKIKRTVLLKMDECEDDISDMNIKDVSDHFVYSFENSGFAFDKIIYTIKTDVDYNGEYITLGDIKEKGDIGNEFFIPDERLYYTDSAVKYADETKEKLSDQAHKTWQYQKGGKKIARISNRDGKDYEYVFSEGPIPMIDADDKPARTMLTTEGGFSRTTHIIKDSKTGRIRLLTPIEMERIQGFPDDWTKECLVDESIVEMPLNKRRFMMGNALVVNLIKQMEPLLSSIIEKE